MKITAGIRTYVNAEGLYSKGQKEAYNGLLKYYTSRDEVDYNEFLMKLENHNFSARDFRLELN
jgi:hypothetical protein